MHNIALTQKTNIVKLMAICCVFCPAFLQDSYAQTIFGDGARNSKITPLMESVNSKDLDGVQFFSKAGKEIINQKNIGGATALQLAARNKDLDIVKILIDNGADVNISDNDGWTPLMKAVSAGDSDIVSELLINGANANKKNLIGESAIIHSANSSCFTCMESVLNYIDYKKIDQKYLDAQFQEAFLIANKKQDSNIKAVLTKFQDNIKKGNYPNVLSNNEKPISDLVKPNESPKKTTIYSFGDIKTKKEQGDEADLSEVKEVENIIKSETIEENKKEEKLQNEIQEELDIVKRTNYIFIEGKKWYKLQKPKGEKTYLKIEKHNNIPQADILEPEIQPINKDVYDHDLESLNETDKKYIQIPETQIQQVRKRFNTYSIKNNADIKRGQSNHPYPSKKQYFNYSNNNSNYSKNKTFKFSRSQNVINNNYQVKNDNNKKFMLRRKIIAKTNQEPEYKNIPQSNINQKVDNFKNSKGYELGKEVVDNNYMKEFEDKYKEEVKKANKYNLNNKKGKLVKKATSYINPEDLEDYYQANESKDNKLDVIGDNVDYYYEVQNSKKTTKRLSTNSSSNLMNFFDYY